MIRAGEKSKQYSCDRMIVGNGIVYSGQYSNSDSFDKNVLESGYL